MTLRRSSRLNASKVLVVVLSLVCVLVSPKTFGTELKAATARAFQQYVDLTEARIRGEVARPSRFLQIDALPETQEPEVRSRSRDLHSIHGDQGRRIARRGPWDRSF